ncbi:uncharacterized protein [Rutidosis leptorrhynchoides]|uniref:uncharacterized protein n=1 Tax=Rutidosis leptorrhynchoides TaxID=125765 RepID=UPI003A9A1DC8
MPNITVKDRMLEGEITWQWRTNPRGRAASDFAALSSLLVSCCLDHTTEDKWKWSKTSDGDFKVKVLASEIDDFTLASSSSNESTLRNNLIPKKVEIFVWRALKRRLPVRLELDKRGIDLHSVRCPLCDDDLESVEHTFILCKHALELWDRVFNWRNLGNFSNVTLQEIFAGNGPTSSSTFGKKIWQALVWTCAYLMWKNRNNLIFKGKGWNGPIALNEIQVKSFEWISQISKGKKFEWLMWLHNPSHYLSAT